MTRRARPGALVAVCLLGLLLPASAGAHPQRLILDRGSAASAPSLRALAAAPAPAAPAQDPPRVLPGRRPFPHDLYVPGAPLPSFPPVSELLRVGLAAAASVAPPDTLRLAIFRVDFLRDGAGDSFTGTGRFDLRTGVTGVPVDPPPHDRRYVEAHAEALARYYAAQSYRSLVIVTTVFPAEPDSAYHLNDTMDYGPWEVSQADEVVRNAEKLVGDMIHAVDASGDVDFASFDAFVVMHAGADFQSDVNRDSERDIPSFTISLAESITVTGGQVGRVLVLPETVSQDGSLGALNGVFAHEFGHVLGLPDLYNIYNGVPQVGYWSLMDSGENIPAIVVDPETEEEYEVVGVFPTSFDPWSRLQLFPRAVAPVLVEEAWGEALEAIEVDPTLPYVVLDDFEHYLVENRALDVDGNGFPYVRQDSTTGVFMGPVDDPELPGQGGRLEYDAVLPGGGLAVWHIDDRIVQPALAGRGDVNLWTLDRGVKIVEADGTYDQGRYDLGRPEDLYYVDNNPRLGPDTIPPSSANDGAWSGVTVETSSNPGRFMHVNITRAGARTGWPLFLPWTDVVTTTVAGVVPLDLDGGKKEILFALDRLDAGTPPSRTRGVGAVRADASPYVTTLFGVAANPLLPGLAATRAFREDDSAVPGGPAFAGTETGGRILLWDAQGDTLLPLRPAVFARTSPVIWPDEGGADRVLYGGTGGLYAVVAHGAVVMRNEPVEAAGLTPTAGPVLIPDGSTTGPVTLGRGALAFEEGRLALFGLHEAKRDVSVHNLGGEVTRLVAGFVAPDLEPRLVAAVGDSVQVLRLVDIAASVEAAWPLPAGMGALRGELALGDLDGDGLAEIAAVTDSGQVAVWNGDGSAAVGWPRAVAAPPQDHRIVDLDGDGELDLLVLDGAGRFHGFDGRGHELHGYPRTAGIARVVDAFVDDLDGDGRLTWVGTAEYGQIDAFRLPGAKAHPGDWRFAAGNPERQGYAPRPTRPSVADAAPDLGPRRLLVFPNPARRGAEIRFLLGDGESAELRLYDVTGTELTDARLDRRGGFHAGENAVRWDLDDVAPGLYLCRLERRDGEGSTVDMAKIVVMR